jgi:hypothetical protein
MALRRLLGRTREPVVVFTEYRDTLAHIARAIATDVSLVMLHGGLTLAERRSAEKTFGIGDVRVLLATDAAGEGLNLHATCRWIINYELPWNPMRLEQRIGRVDRIGQRRVVHATSLVAAGTHETKVLARLFQRLARIRTTLGAVTNPVGGAVRIEDRGNAARNPPSSFEEMIGRGILDGHTHEDMVVSPAPVEPSADQVTTTCMSTAAALYTMPSEEVRLAGQHEAARLEFVRALRPPHRTRRFARTGEVLSTLDTSAPWVTILRRQPVRLPPGLLWVFKVPAADGSGVPVETVLVSLHLPARPPSVSNRAAAGDVARRHWAAVSGELRVMAARHAAERLQIVRQSRTPGILLQRERELAIAASRRESLTVRLVQPGLFDRRSVHEAKHARQRAEAADAEAAAAVAALDASLDVVMGEPQLMLIGIVC